MNEEIIKIDNVEICTESFGNPKNPAVLLIMGAMSSLDWWDEDFCLRLAEHERFVIRYDHRDLGRSTTYPPGTSNYTITDMADDAIGVLDAYSIDKAHIVGMSLGGMIGQILALRYPDRIDSLTLIASSVFGTEAEKLPPMDQRILDYHTKSASIDWSNQEETVPYLAGGWKILSGTKPYEEKRMYKLAEREAARAKQLPSRFNHALLQGGGQYYDRLSEITIPTLIIHGTEDPALPYEHGLALAKAIAHANLIALDRTGHEVHSEDWEQIIKSIVRISS
ncbi:MULTISPECIES: alpha/beta fold hydrolase [Priestia]|jgi:pimeloyl-ACP methyl ester carboxylesterase|uniref:alpha/beta fold hydrolase n=2 Tax=Bacillati TaxID=1783272 RepID=UPI0005C524AA|nr:alpha/beta hydrolase [Priestia megaterium]MCF8888769.1 alpha/beta fold hydrolase [Priestia megaterium]NGY82584.1 alpha/beta hydrolase [Priestia megaterium]PEC45274.1 putative esterase [Priestia megaterium]